jgi:hypothetical protein
MAVDETNEKDQTGELDQIQATYRMTLHRYHGSKEA